MNRFGFQFLLLHSILLLLCCGCSSDTPGIEVVEFAEFQKEYELKSEPAEWIDIWNCYQLRIFDDYLVALDWKAKQLFKVYKLDSKALVGAFGVYGKGPDEFFQAPDITSFYYYEADELIIQLYDKGRRKLLNINLTKSINDNKLHIISEYKISDDDWSSDPIMINTIIYSADSSVLKVNNISTGVISKSHKPIDTDQVLAPMHAKIVRIMYLEKAAGTDKIVSSFNVQKRLHIYNLDGELLRIIKEKGRNNFDLSDESFYTVNKTHFSSSFPSDKYILVLDEDRIERNKGGELLLFDYKGNAITKYKLNSYIFKAALDWRTGKLYAFNSQEGTMISYTLPGL